MNGPDTITATITNDERSFSEDMELPSGMPVSELGRQIMLILKDIHEDIFSGWTSCRLECRGRILDAEDTLLKAGVFDGSVIVVRT